MWWHCVPITQIGSAMTDQNAREKEATGWALLITAISIGITMVPAAIGFVFGEAFH